MAAPQQDLHLVRRAFLRHLDLALTGGARPQQIESMMVSENFFDVVGAKAAIGRTPLAPATRPAVTAVITTALDRVTRPTRRS